MGNYCFIPYVVVLVLFVAFTYFKVPETKNKTTEEIVAMFQSESQKSDKARSQLDNMSSS